MKGYTFDVASTMKKLNETNDNEKAEIIVAVIADCHT